jgi:hypothetical protein
MDQIEDDERPQRPPQRADAPEPALDGVREVERWLAWYRDVHDESASPGSARLDRCRREFLSIERGLSRLADACERDPEMAIASRGLRRRLRGRRAALVEEFGKIVAEWFAAGGQAYLVDPAATSRPQGSARPRGGEREPASRARSARAPSSEARRPRPSSPGRVRSESRASKGPRGRRSASSRPSEPKLDASEQRRLVRDLLDELAAPPREIDSMPDLIDEIERLDRSSDREHLAQWSRLSDEMQHALGSYVTTRARRVQEEREYREASSYSPNLQQRLDDIFPRLGSFMKRERPGFVHGLMRSHDPERASWLADARHWYKVLREEYLDGEDASPTREAADREGDEQRSADRAEPPSGGASTD